MPMTAARPVNGATRRMTSRSTGPPVVSSTTGELDRGVQGDASAARADRVAERDGTPVDVDDVRREAELLDRDEADRRERFVDLDEVEVGRREAFLLQRGEQRRRRLDLQAV